MLRLGFFFFFGVLSAINFMSGNKFYTSGDISLLDLVERENFFFFITGNSLCLAYVFSSTCLYGVTGSDPLHIQNV